MADENTNDSTPTETTASPAVTPEQDSSTTSTTETEQSPSEGGTLLTGDAPAEKPSESENDNSSEPDPTAAFYGAPEDKYELALPEGTVVDADALDAITPIAKQLNLSNEGLSQIAGVYAEKVLPAVVEKVTDGLNSEIAAAHAQWAGEAVELVKTDPVFGGKQLTEVQQVSAKALDRFGGEEFRSFLNETGLGNHPAMLRFAYLAGSLISEDTTFERGSTAPQPKSRTERFYGPQT